MARRIFKGWPLFTDKAKVLPDKVSLVPAFLVSLEALEALGMMMMVVQHHLIRLVIGPPVCGELSVFLFNDPGPCLF